MIDAIYIAGSGIKCQQDYVNTISNNIANINTIGYKKNDVSFAEMTDSGVNADGVDDTRAVGGVRVSDISQQFSAGELKQTDNPLDLAIVGQGFFEVTLEDGRQAYTRVGRLQVDNQGQLETQSGYKLTANISIPAEATDLAISKSGEISVTLPGESEPVVLGEIELADFNSASALSDIGGGLFVANKETGTAGYAKPGQDGMGIIQQGYVEASNVSMISEMVSLVLAQRAYQLNARVIQTSDQLMETTNNLIRS